jgi:aminopeptidase
MKFNRTIMEKYCDVLLWALKTARKGTFRKGDVILVSFHMEALPVAELLQARLLVDGFHPVLRLRSTPRMERDFFSLANPKQLVFQTPGSRELHKALNGAIYLYAPESLTHLSTVDPRRIGRAAVAAKPLRDVLERREERGLFGWTLCLFPTPGLAKHAGLTLQRYGAEVIRACYLDRNDPVKEWKETHREITAIKKWLNGMEIEALHMESDTIDLVVTPGRRRKWVGVSGHNIPSFEIFVSPDWRGTEGVFFSDQPSFRNGNYVQGVRLVFEKGKAVKVEATKGEEFTLKQLSMDEGACRIGEFSLTDRRFSKIARFMANTLYDENFGGRYGNCHIALGSSYSDTYDGNPGKLTREAKQRLGFNESALHWDLVNTERKVITAHLRSGAKKIIYEDGMFRCG